MRESLLEALGGGLGPALVGSSSYAGPELFLKPPAAALPKVAEAWARAAPHARAALAFGDVPAAAWREDGAALGDFAALAEKFPLGRPGPGTALLLRLLARSPRSSASALNRVAVEAVERKDGGGCRVCCALLVACLRAPAVSRGALRSPDVHRAACPPALAIVLANWGLCL